MANARLSSRLGTPSNLPTGATYDLLMLSFPDGFPQGLVKFNIDSTPRKVTGIQKVAQTFLKILFTTAGSDVLNPDRGTNFPNITVGANITESDSVLASDLTGEVRSAEAQTRYILNTQGSDVASQLAEIQVLGVETTGEGATMYMRIITAAGEFASVGIPFPQMDLALNE